jgi:hypothetical protein
MAAEELRQGLGAAYGSFYSGSSIASRYPLRGNRHRAQWLIYNLFMRKASRSEDFHSIAAPTAEPDVAPTPPILPLKREWRAAVLGENANQNQFQAERNVAANLVGHLRGETLRADVAVARNPKADSTERLVDPNIDQIIEWFHTNPVTAAVYIAILSYSRWRKPSSRCRGSVATLKTVTKEAPIGNGRRGLRQPDRTAR